MTIIAMFGASKDLGQKYKQKPIHQMSVSIL